ncbi:MAG TPA: glutathione S-transferase family protein [Gaiellaceae bacterium]|nr:glutathione S-transferase family protein [Gaiellaceae bacterium]
MLTLYDADRCPYCARARIVLAEKGVEYETVTVDLSDRPDWIYEKNPLGKVPVLEEEDFLLPESEVIMQYLEERYPEPALLPADPAARARIRLVIHRFDVNLGDAYYAFRRRDENGAERLEHCLGKMERLTAAWPFPYGLADIAYLPWLIRLRGLLGYDLSPFPQLSARLDELAERPAIAAELDVVAALPR